jgi:hypothetical protein
MMVESRFSAAALSLILFVAQAEPCVGQNGPQIPALDTEAACRRPNSGDDCISKDALAKAAVLSLWATASEARRSACSIFVLLGPTHGYTDLQDCLAGTADLSPMMTYLRLAQERHYKYRFFYSAPDVAIPVETLGDCVGMQRRWKTGVCTNGPQ